MKLKELSEKSGLRGLEKLDGSINITGINDRSSAVKMNEIFVAIKGFKHDGHDRISDAIENGAVLVMKYKFYSLNVHIEQPYTPK